MSNNYWLDAWQQGKIAFHQSTINQFLLFYFNQLNIKSNSRILVPLCGKTSDMLWLHQQGHKITGVELSNIACRDFFIENDLSYKLTIDNKFKRYGNDNIELMCGDIFAFDDQCPFQMIYDRGALVAFPPIMRQEYVVLLTQLSMPGTILFLVAFESDCKPMCPPFPISYTEINDLFGHHFTIQQLKKQIVSEIPKNMLEHGCKKLFFSAYLFVRF